MAMTVNPDAGTKAPDTFHEEGLYAFRFDVNDDAHEEVTFKICIHARSPRLSRAAVQIGGSARGYQAIFVPSIALGSPGHDGQQPHMLTFPAGISTVESTWVGCYDWCLA